MLPLRAPRAPAANDAAALALETLDAAAALPAQPLVVVDQHQRIVAANPAAALLFGRADLLDFALPDLLAQERGGVVRTTAAVPGAARLRLHPAPLGGGERWAIAIEVVRRTPDAAFARAAHDVNQLLSMVVGNAELAIAAIDSGEADPARLRGALAAIARSGLDAAAALRSTATASGEPPRAVDLRSVLVDVVNLTRPRWARRTNGVIRIRVTGSAQVRARVVPSGLRNALTNLVVNSIEALPAGGDITLGCAQEGDHALAWVADTGPGFPAGDAAAWMEPGASTKGSDGRGHGLASVAAFARESAGALEVLSSAGAGARLQLRLPLAKAIAEPSEQALR